MADTNRFCLLPIATSLVGTLGLSLLNSQPAVAASLTWTISEVTFANGVLSAGGSFLDSGPASGSFNYDADTDQYTDVQITTGDGYLYQQLGGFTDPQPISNSQSLYLFRQKTTLYEPFSSSLLLQFAQPLTNTLGASVGIAAVSELRAVRDQAGFDIETRTLAPGSHPFAFVSTQPVPEPTTMLGGGVAGVAAGWLKRRQASKA